MRNEKRIKIRLILYFIGLFIMTLGIAMSVKSDLGVSPVSSIPYTITCIWGLRWERRPFCSMPRWSFYKC